MTKTKIITSITKENSKSENIEEMIINGADVVHLDSSVLEPNLITNTIKEVQTINNKLNAAISTILEIEGPCVRTGRFKEGLAEFKTGDRIRMHMNPIFGSTVGFSVDYPDLIKNIKINDIIKLSNGTVVLQVDEIGLDFAVCKVVKGGFVKNNSKLYLKDTEIKREYLTGEIKEKIILASKLNIDYLLVSNIYDEEDILEINDLLIECQNNHISVLVKADNTQVINNIDKIISLSDGVVIAQDELEISTAIEKMSTIKKEIIQKCQNNGKISVTAIQKLSKVPINSFEINEIVNNIEAGIDAVLLKNNYNDFIKNLKAIIKNEELNLDYEYLFNKAFKTEIKNIPGTIVSNAVSNAKELKCKAIITITSNGMAARKISRFRPCCEVIAIVPNEQVAKSLNPFYGIIPVVIKDSNFDVLIQKARIICQKILDLKKDDKIIIVGSHPYEKSAEPNLMKIEEI